MGFESASTSPALPATSEHCPHLAAQAAGGSKAGGALEKYSGVKVKVGCARALCWLCMGGKARQWHALRPGQLALEGFRSQGQCWGCCWLLREGRAAPPMISTAVQARLAEHPSAAHPVSTHELPTAAGVVWRQRDHVHEAAERRAEDAGGPGPHLCHPGALLLNVCNLTCRWRAGG